MRSKCESCWKCPVSSHVGTKSATLHFESSTLCSWLLTYILKAYCIAVFCIMTLYDCVSFLELCRYPECGRSNFLLDDGSPLWKSTGQEPTSLWSQFLLQWKLKISFKYLFPEKLLVLITKYLQISYKSRLCAQDSNLRDLRLPLQSRKELRFSGLLRSE